MQTRRHQRRADQQQETDSASIFTSDALTNSPTGALATSITIIDPRPRRSHHRCRPRRPRSRSSRWRTTMSHSADLKDRRRQSRRTARGGVQRNLAHLMDFARALASAERAAPRTMKSFHWTARTPHTSSDRRPARDPRQARRRPMRIASASKQADPPRQLAMPRPHAVGEGSRKMMCRARTTPAPVSVSRRDPAVPREEGANIDN